MKFAASSALATVVALSLSHTVCGFATVHQQHRQQGPFFLPGVRTTARTTSSLLFATEKSIESVHQDADVIFSVIDKDGNGYLELGELLSHLKPAGYSEEVIETIFKKMDMNADGQISRDEFQGGMVLLTALQSAPGLGNYNAEFVKEIHEDADQVFQSVDANNNGSIDVKELKDHLGRKFDGFSEAAIDRIFLMLDFDGNKGIDRDELRDAFCRYSALRQAIGEGPNFK